MTVTTGFLWRMTMLIYLDTGSATIQIELLLEGNKHTSSHDSLRETETMKIKG